MSLVRRGDELRLAAALLTRIPVGTIANAPSLGDSRWAWPLIGAGLGGLCWAVMAMATALEATSLLAAFLALAALTLTTGALHDDGLADYADGAGAGGDRKRRLQIMADSRLGSYGALALVFSVGLRATAIAAVGPAFWAFIAVEAGSRATMILVQETTDPARTEGMGAAASGEGAGGWRTPLGLGAGLGCLLPLGSPGLACGVAMTGAAFLLGRHAQARLGGHTGDVLGASQQVAAIAGWTALAALLA